MGCDIHSHAEKKSTEGWECLNIPAPFDWRSYGLYGFLADVRNYSAVPTLAPQRGLPADVSRVVKEDSDSWDGDGHSHSWLSMDELLGFNYDAPMEDRRYTQQTGPYSYNGGATAEPGQGKMTTFREFLGANYFKELERLKETGAERIVFWFDN